DWTEPDSTGTNRLLDELSRAGIRVNLVDTSHPYRNELQSTPIHHDNLSIVELRPETRVAAKDLPVQFRVTVANHGAAERANLRVAVKVNGSERLEGDVTVTVPPGGTKSETFPISLNELGFNLISVNLENE